MITFVKNITYKRTSTNYTCLPKVTRHWRDSKASGCTTS